MSKDSLTVTDNRTGKSYEIANENGAIKALDLRQIKAGDTGGRSPVGRPASSRRARATSTRTMRFLQA